MPDWTYEPLRPAMQWILGARRSQRWALAAFASLVRIPGGRYIAGMLGRTQPPASARCSVAGVSCSAPAGASVRASVARDALDSLPVLGAGLIEVDAPFFDAVRDLRPALERSHVPVMLRVSGPDAVEVCRQLGDVVQFLVVAGGARDDDEVSRLAHAVDLPIAEEISPDSAQVPSHRSTVVVTDADEAAVRRLTARHEVLARLSSPSVVLAATLLAAGAKAVLATESALISSGPGWFQRVTGLIVKPDPGSQADKSGVAWVSGVAFGLGMIGGGVGAALVALGPVLLPYDAAFLGLSVDRLRIINPQLIHFLQHDRITLAGTMVALGTFYFALSWFGIRRRRAWTRDAMLASGIVGFPTLFYFFSYHYVEPAHAALALVLFPLFLIAVRRRPLREVVLVDGDENPTDRSHGLLGQLLMAATGFGLVAGGITISLVGLSTVFVPSDLTFMSTSPTSLAEANARLIGFVAHDRAGFGGALISSGVAVFLLAAWGWHRGEAWVWWSLFAAAIAGFGAAIGVHYWVGYTDFFHLAPVYAGTILSGLSLGLSRRYLLARRAGVGGSIGAGRKDGPALVHRV